MGRSFSHIPRSQHSHLRVPPSPPPPPSSDRSASAPSPRPGYAAPQLEESERLLSDIERAFEEVEAALGDQYVAVKAQHMGMAVIRYFLEDGTQWPAAPPVKGLRDSALDLMLPLVAVHAEVRCSEEGRGGGEGRHGYSTWYYTRCALSDDMCDGVKG